MVRTKAESLRPFLPTRLGSRSFLPRTLWTGGLSLVAVFHTVVMVTIRNRAQRLVVQTRHSGRFLQLFRELVYGLQVVGRRGDFALRCHQELLVAAVHKLRYLTLNKVAGMREHLHAVAVRLDRRRYAVLLQEHALLRPRCFQDVEAVIAQPLNGVVEAALLNLS